MRTESPRELEGYSFNFPPPHCEGVHAHLPCPSLSREKKVGIMRAVCPVRGAGELALGDLRGWNREEEERILASMQHSAPRTEVRTNEERI